MRSEIQVNMISQIVHLLLLLHLLFEKVKLTNHSTYEPEILHVNQSSSELVHRHIIYSLTLLLLVKQLIMGPDNTLQCTPHIIL